MHVNTTAMTNGFDLVSVTLSRQNLLTLIEELDEGRRPVIRKTIDATALLVIAEENEVHYKDERFPKGGLG